MMEPRTDVEVSMPNLVFELVSKHLCPKILRPCRLVCKSWNDIACEILQTYPVAFREVCSQPQKQEYNQRLKDFLDLLASRIEEISHPFRKISIKAKCMEDNCWDLILRLQQYKDIEVSNLEFEHWTDDQESIDLKRKIMTWTQSTLRSLSLSIKGPFVGNQFEWKLENLKKLEINYWKGSIDPKQGSIKTLLENILRWPKLSRLSLKFEIGDFETLKELLSMEKIRRVFSLEIRRLIFDDKNRGKNSDIVRYFTQNSILNVKNLEIFGKLEFTLPLIGIFSQSLEILSYTQFGRHSETLLALDCFPRCPRLRELNLIQSDMCAKGNSFVEKFPSLKRFSCRLGLKILGEVKPHFGVEYLNFRVNSNHHVFEHNSETCTCCKVGRDILHHFPHLNHNICQGKENLCAGVETLWSMVNYFPNVRALKIRHCGELIDFVSEIGTTLFSDDVMDVRFENVFRDLFPLQNFRKLNSLDVTLSDVILTPAVIRLGLGRIPTLKHFRFEYRPSEYDNETVKAFRECLEPLNELQLVKLCSHTHKERINTKEAFKAKLFPLVVNWFCNGNYCDCDCEMKTCKCQYCKNIFPFE